MGTVYEAIDRVDGARVALKTWHSPPDPDDRNSSRFYREAHALSEIQHPAVVRYIDHGETPEHGPFLAMSWVSGETLARRLAGGGIAPADALMLVERIAAGLSAMHARGIVHRDLKPSNIMLEGGDVTRPIIVDFGIASVLGASGVTATGAHLGTPRYMAPEQIRNARTVDGRADVFALGCILFECVAGRPAFDGTDPVSVLARILFEPLPVASAVRRDLPPPLDALLLSMLVREVDKRPSSGALGNLFSSARAAAPGLDALGPAAAMPPGPKVADVGPAGFEPTAYGGTGPTAAPPSLQVGHNAVITAVRRAFPPQAGRFVGREDEVNRLLALLLGGAPIVTVWGGPGIGKTRLVLEAIRRATAAEEPPWDALIFADLGAARDGDDIVRILAREAGVTMEPSQAPEVALGAALGKLGRVLLVLDPAEHIATPLAATTHAFHRTAPGLTMLITSRSRFSPPGAAALELGPLPTLGQLDHASRTASTLSPAAVMFLDRAGQLLPSIERARDQTWAPLAEQAERLVALLEGIPLAIELCAARVHVLGMEGLLARVASPPGANLDTQPAPQGPMAQALAWSWKWLEPAEQAAFAQCAVFRGGFSVDAAESVVSVSFMEHGAAETVTEDHPSFWPNNRVQGQILELIQSLRDKSLLYSWSAASGSEVRLSMFGPVRDFAWQKLRTSGLLAGALLRHAEYYARSYGPGSANGADPKRLARLERDAENLLAAAEYALSDECSDKAVGLRALLALEPAIRARGAYGTFRSLLDRALAYGDAPDCEETKPLAARVRQVKARLDAPAGRAASARTDLEACLAQAVREGDVHWQASLLLDLGVVHHFERALAEARRCYQAALDLLRLTDDLAAEGRCIGNLGALHHDDGNFSEAARSYRQAIALLQETGEVRQRANFIGNLAVLEQELGHATEARALYREAVALLEPLREARVLAITLGNLGVLELELGQFEEGVALFQRSLALLAGSGDLRTQALCHARLGIALARLGRVDEAEARLVRAERLAQSADVLVSEAIALDHAFVDVARAEIAVRGEAWDGAEDHRKSAHRRMDRVMTSEGGSRSLRDQSDDIRSSLRMLEPAVSALDSAMEDRRCSS
jgi:predicted ATPase/Flp pilus assembly protein TadD